MTVAVVTVTMMRMAVDGGGRVDRGSSSEGGNARTKGDALEHLMEYNNCEKGEEEGVSRNNQGDANYCNTWSAVVHMNVVGQAVTYE